MALPPMTLEGVRPFLPESINRVLADRHTDEDIPQLFSNEGYLRLIRCAGHASICMRWIRNEEDEVTGIFFRVLSSRHIAAFISPRHNPNPIENYKEISISKNKTDLKHSVTPPEPNSFFSNGMPVRITREIQLHRLEVPFNIDQIDNIEAIRQFFASNPELLPDNLRERVFLPEAPPVDPPPRPQENGEPANYKLLIGSLLAFAVISYIAIKVLHKPPKVEVK